MGEGERRAGAGKAGEGGRYKDQKRKEKGEGAKRAGTGKAGEGGRDKDQRRKNIQQEERRLP